jgi:hypothetical protein
MKKVINLLLAVLTTGCVSAQWTYKTVDNGFDEPYKIAHTAENNGAFLKLEKVDTFVIWYIQGGYYCDDKPDIDVVFVVKGVNKKYNLKGTKNEKNNVVFFPWNLDIDENLNADFKGASSVKIRINESYCTSEVYEFNMSNSKAAYDFMIK